jgi:glycosyltransferase involved in cell wall biosynthesis
MSAPPAHPLVSVNIAVYNGARYLGEALESVFAQTYRPIEVIVLDDGSTDATAEVAASFSEARYIYQENQGLSHARNAGIRESNGAFLAFIDHDDTWAPDKLARQVALLQERPDLGFAVCYLENLFEDGTVPGWFRQRDDIHRQPGYVPSAWLVRREIFDIVGLFDPVYRIGQDTDWLARAKDAGIRHGIVEGEPLLAKRVHGANMMSAVRRSHEEMLHMLRASIERQRSGGK